MLLLKINTYQFFHSQVFHRPKALESPIAIPAERQSNVVMYCICPLISYILMHKVAK
jgi:hypothetical protein